MKIVGVIGESPNDTTSLCKIWNERYAKRGRFTPALKNLKGTHLDSAKAQRMMKLESKSSDCQFYIYVRDLDGPRSSKEHWEKINKSFKSMSTIGEVLLLTNIQMMEAFILGDIETFNKLYGANVNFKGNPESQNDPKSFLKTATAKTAKKYHETHCPDLIPQLDFSKVESRCQFYRDFISTLDKALK